jgi:hypothetical protein
MYVCACNHVCAYFDVCIVCCNAGSCDSSPRRLISACCAGWRAPFLQGIARPSPFHPLFYYENVIVVPGAVLRVFMSRHTYTSVIDGTGQTNDAGAADVCGIIIPVPGSCACIAVLCYMCPCHGLRAVTCSRYIHTYAYKGTIYG